MIYLITEMRKGELMPNNAFTAGVKPGGLTNSTEIRILLCYLMHSVEKPLTEAEIQSALLGEELVNYFELADSLAALCAQGLAVIENGHYTLLNEGHVIAATLAQDVPRSVRETAVRAALMAQQFSRKQAQHKAAISEVESGYMVRCSIEDVGSEVFSCSLYVPDKQSAALVKERFVDAGAEIYKIMLAALTGNKQLISDILTDNK